jgi:hypothetical protein
VDVLREIVERNSAERGCEDWVDWERGRVDIADVCGY